MCQSGLCQLCRPKPYSLYVSMGFHAQWCLLQMPSKTASSLLWQPLAYPALHDCHSRFSPHASMTPNVVLCLLIYLNMNVMYINGFLRPTNFWSDFGFQEWPFSHFDQIGNGGFYLEFYGGANFKIFKETKQNHATLMDTVNIFLCSKTWPRMYFPSTYPWVSADTEVQAEIGNLTGICWNIAISSVPMGKSRQASPENETLCFTLCSPSFPYWQYPLSSGENLSESSR